MYESEAPPTGVANARWTLSTSRRVPANVWLLGLTSLLTDISSEMVTSVLPIYVLVQLGLSPLAFGALDGLSHGMTAVTRWVSGVVADRTQRHKEVALLGYSMSAICRLALLPVQGHLTGLGAVVAVDRLGKGIRTAPRDALISLSAPLQSLGQAFGVHRALDATGAMLGPLAAFAVLAAVPNGFDVVFVMAFSVALVGLGVLALFVHNAPPRESTGERTFSVSAALPLFAHADFRNVLTIASLLALFTIGDGFVYLSLRERLAFPPRFFPLLFVGTSLVYLLLAVPAGRLSDRFGRLPVFLAGHLALGAVYGLLVNPPSSAVAAVLVVGLLGVYYAATDGVIAALASSLLPAQVRGSGLALVGTSTSLCRLIGALLFGWTWSSFGRETALIGFGMALAAGLLVTTFLFVRRTRSA